MIHVSWFSVELLHIDEARATETAQVAAFYAHPTMHVYLMQHIASVERQSFQWYMYARYPHSVKRMRKKTEKETR